MSAWDAVNQVKGFTRDVNTNMHSKMYSEIGIWSSF